VIAKKSQVYRKALAFAEILGRLNDAQMTRK
jgi:hypothetical protein